MDLLLTLRGFKATEVKGEYWILSTGEQHVCFIKVIVLGHGVSQYIMLRGGSVAVAIVLICTVKVKIISSCAHVLLIISVFMVN